MDRSRSCKRYYNHQDYDSEINPRTKPRYNSNSYHHQHHRRPSGVGVGGGGSSGVTGGGGRKIQDPSLTVTTSYKILCHDIKAGGVIGKSGWIIKNIRHHTGAWINVHELIPGDEERIIEISDTRRRDPDGRMPAFSPAQEALFLIHDRIIESENGGGGAGGNGYGYGNVDKVVTRLVVSRMHVGSLLGKGGKIIEQMKMETKTHIRILPRDQTLPRCVAMSEEIVQVVGDVNSVKNAITNISLRLRESQHRDRSHFNGRLDSPERFFPPNDDFIPHMNNAIRRTSAEGGNVSYRFPEALTGGRGNNYSSRQSGQAVDFENNPNADSLQLFWGEVFTFRILCPIEKVNRIFGEQDGIIDLLQNEVGVDVKTIEPVAGSNEQILIVASDEGPDDELSSGQEALLHIQTHIVDLDLEKENIVTTRLLLQSDEIGCLGGKDGPLAAIKQITGVDLQILPWEGHPLCVSDTDEVLQIVGEIKAAREALLGVTSKLRSYNYRDYYGKGVPVQSVPRPMESNIMSEEDSGRHNMVASQEDNLGTNPRASTTQNGPNKANVQLINSAATQRSSVSASSGGEAVKHSESELRSEIPTGLNRTSIPLVTRSTLEVSILPNAASKLITKSRNKLAQISELSGANVQLVEDRAEGTEQIIQISGTPEQAERAQSLLQGFILSTEEDDS